LEGPQQAGQGNNGQYMYWIVTTHPTEEAVAQHHVRVPSEFDRNSFHELLVEAHTLYNVDILETMCFLEGFLFCDLGCLLRVIFGVS